MGDHPSWPALARRLERCTRFLGGPRRRNLLHLAPDGVWRAAVSPRRWCALTPPFHPYRRRLRRVVRRRRSPFCATFRRLSPPGVSPASCPAVSGLSSERTSARGHPACEPNCNPDSARLSARATLIPHSGQQISPRRCSTNSPQTRHSRLAPRSSAKSSCSSVRFNGATRHSARNTPTTLPRIWTCGA